MRGRRIFTTEYTEFHGGMKIVVYRFLTPTLPIAPDVA